MVYCDEESDSDADSSKESMVEVVVTKEDQLEYKRNDSLSDYS